MCIVAIANRASHRYPLIVAANRDERHARPSAAAEWWQGPGSLLAGRDLVAGGTWLGVTGSGRVAAVTNIFEGASATGELSRGTLVSEFLQGAEAATAYAERVAAEAARYGPFNLVLRSPTELHFLSNRKSASALEDGIHVFSNNAPGLEWSKLGLLGEAIAAAAHRQQAAEFLIETLSGPQARGPLDRAADALFVVGDEFGTRCTTVLVVDATGKASFIEQRFAAGGAPEGRSAYSFEFAL